MIFLNFEFFPKANALAIEDDPLGRSPGKTNSRIQFAEFKDEAHAVVAKCSRPFFSSNYIEVIDNNSQQHYWVCKTSLSRRFSKTAEEVEFLKQFFKESPGQKTRLDQLRQQFERPSEITKERWQGLWKALKAFREAPHFPSVASQVAWVQCKRGLVEILKLAARNDICGLELDWNELRGEDESVRIEVAKYCAQLRGGFIARKIKEFGITNQNALIEIAKICAGQDGWATAKEIHHFGIIDQAALIAIAKICLGGAHGAAEYIENLPLAQTGNALRFELAKISASKDPWGTAKWIQKFGITDQTELIEIAKICAANSIRGTACCFENFGIQSEAARIEIAKICAGQDGWATAEWIQNFGITDQAALIEIAKLCALRNGRTTAKYIKNFKIVDQDARIEIFKSCFTQYAEGALDWFSEFGIGDERKRIELIGWCASRNGDLVAKAFASFQIQSEVFLKTIAPLCAIQNPQALHNLNSIEPSLSFFFNLFDPYIHWAQDVRLSSDASQAKREDILAKYIEDYLPGCGFEWVVSYLQKMDNLHAREQVTVSLGAALFVLRQKLTDEQLKAVNESGLVRRIYEMRTPDRYLPFISLLAQFASLDRGLEIFKQKPPLRLENYRWCQLFRMIWVQFEVAGVAITPLVDRLNRDQYKTFKYAQKAQLLLDVLRRLLLAPALTPTQKQALMGKLVARPKLYEAAVSLSLIFDLEEEALLQDNEKEISQLSKEAIRKQIPFPGLEDIALSYSNTFGVSRYPMGFWQYAAGLKTLNNPLLMESLAEYACSVFGKTFQNKRYELEKNPHLAKLETKKPGLVASWRKGLESDATSNALSLDPLDWAKTKLITDRHMGDPNQFNVLKSYLENAFQREQIYQERATATEFERACLDFLRAETKEAQRASLQVLKNRSDGEFANDVDGFISALNTDQSNGEKLRVMETDDPYLLFFCGTDVQGSCQRIGGNPTHNQGLLGYLLNGQTRLIAVVDKDNKIQTRALLRLLWDGEKPVLYLERCYGNLALEANLIRLAKEKAVQMGLALITSAKGDDELPPFDKDLVSLGGRAPCEYCDGAKGVHLKGAFTIPASELRLLHALSI